jgi:hypothetical protein
MIYTYDRTGATADLDWKGLAHDLKSSGSLRHLLLASPLLEEAVKTKNRRSLLKAQELLEDAVRTLQDYTTP